MDSKRFIWQETAPGQCEREIDETEQFYSFMAKTWEGIGHTYFAITACIGVKVAQPAGMDLRTLDERIDASFRSAWEEVRFDHPTLAAPVVYDPTTKTCKKVYKTPSSKSDIEAWLKETFDIIDNGLSGEEFANTDPPVRPISKLYLVKPKQTYDGELRRDIVFRSPHDIIDGLGSFYLLSNLLRYAASTFASEHVMLSYEFGDELQHLSPPFRLAAAIPSSPAPAQVSKLEEIRKLNALARSNTAVLSLPFTSSKSTPGKCQRVSVHLSPMQSSAIISKCRSLNATPTHAFQAGIAFALRDLQPRAAQPHIARYISYSLINLRNSCFSPYNTPQHATSVYHYVSALHLVIEVMIPSSSATSTSTQDQGQNQHENQRQNQHHNPEFLAAVEQVRTFAHNTQVDEDYLSIVPTLFSSVTPLYPIPDSTPSLPSLSTTLPIPEPNPTPSPTLSSLGVADHIFQPRYRAFEIVSSPWVIGGEYGTGYGLFLSTWNGSMELSAAYNEAFHSAEEVRSFLESVRRIVAQDLEVAEE